MTFASYWAQPWGHVDFKALVAAELDTHRRQIRQQETLSVMAAAFPAMSSPAGLDGTKTTSCSRRRPATGIGRYINDTNNGALATNYLAVPTTAAAAAKS